VSDTILDRWCLSAEQLTEIIDGNPSLRGILLGYVAEAKLRELWFGPPTFEDCRKPDDHDRTEKCDLLVLYKGECFRVEVKSVQTNSIRRTDGKITARFQCDASDRRVIELPGGKKVNTTCLKTGDFDIVAVNLYAFHGEWRFAFARNQDLPRSEHKAYPAAVRKYLLASLVPITWPLGPPFRDEPTSLLEEILKERKRT
jgi:hypothetical protein